MQTQIPIKLPECDILSHGDDSDYDTAEDADDDGDGDERKGETIWIFFLTRSRRKKGRREKRTKKKKRDRCCSSLSLSLARTRDLFFSTLSLFSRARESFSPLGFSFVRSFDIRLLTKQQQLFLFENKTQNNAKRSPRRRNTSRNSRTKRAGRICSSY